MSIPEAFNVQSFILSFYSGSIRRPRRRRISGYCCSKNLTVQFPPLRDFSAFLCCIAGHSMHPMHPGQCLRCREQKSLKGGNSLFRIIRRTQKLMETPARQALQDLSGDCIRDSFNRRRAGQVQKDDCSLIKILPLRDFYTYSAWSVPGTHT